MAPSTPPTRELGTPGGITTAWQPGNGRRKYEIDPLEENQELRFPESIPVYDRMRSQDGHVESILSAVTLPVVKADWQLEGDVAPEVEQLVRESLGIPKPGEARARNAGYGISWKDHITQCAPPMLWAGFMAFEQVYVVNEATGQIHLRKLAPRPPRTITRIEVAKDGGLEAIYQTPVWTPGMSVFEETRISVDRLVMYTHRKEGADWTGRSMLRAANKHWLIKDVLLRLDAQAAERNSMGIPVVSYDDPSQKETAEAIAANARAGATAGVALPRGMSMKIIGTEGSTVDLIPRIRYHDQEIARSALAMFLDMTSNENGSRALAEPILDVFMDSVQAFADSIAETATEHVVRDLVRLNFGPEAAYPSVVPGDLKAARGIVVEQLKGLVEAKVIEPDDELEKHQRAKYGLPEKHTESRRENPAQAPPPPPYADTAVVQDQLPGLDELTQLAASLREAQQERTRWYASRTGAHQ